MKRDGAKRRRHDTHRSSSHHGMERTPIDLSSSRSPASKPTHKFDSQTPSNRYCYETGLGSVCVLVLYCAHGFHWLLVPQ